MESSGNAERVLYVAGEAPAGDAWDAWEAAARPFGVAVVRLPPPRSPGAPAAYALAAQRACVDGAALYTALVDGGLWRAVLFGRLLPSTQRILTDALPIAPVGTVCVATQQDRGVGRGGNVWTSPMGCLCVSFTAALVDPAHLVTVQYVAALAVVLGVRDGATEADWHAAPLRLKWPNDVYAGCHKVAGILCCSRYDPVRGGYVVTVGIGLNVSNAEPTTCLDALHPSTAPHTREGVLCRMLARFASLLRTLGDEGFGHSLRDAYTSHWLHTGQHVTLTDGTAAVVTGLSDEGHLLAAIGDQVAELHPDGTSFDMSAGVLRRKSAPNSGM